MQALSRPARELDDRAQPALPFVSESSSGERAHACLPVRMACKRLGVGVSHPPVADWVLEIDEGGAVRREPLAPGLTRIGGPGCEVILPRAGADQLHLWDAPPKLVFVGKGERPRVGGQAVDEVELAGGERVEWLGVGLRLVSTASARAAAPAPSGAAPEEPAWTQVKAGLLFELGLADKNAAKRWQQAIARGQFDADACARELVSTSRTAPGDQRLRERCTRLLRELLMGPGQQRGSRPAARAERRESRSLPALIAMQVIVILSQVFLFAVVLVIVRWRWGWSVDGFLDQVLERVRGGT